MNWNAFREHRCPRCNSKLETHGMLSDLHTCSDSHCLFKINDTKFQEILGNILKKEAKHYNPEPNLEALNNLEL